MALKKNSAQEPSRPVLNKNKDQKNLNLEALRGILAIMVLIGHVFLIRLYFGRSNNYLLNPTLFHLGRVAVTGFFVLSGYLITLSILKKMELKEWNIKTFYLARIFRIWPLYFFVIAIAILVLPHIELVHFTVPKYLTDVRINTHKYWYYFFLVPQIPLIDNCVLPFAEPTWSIGVEEIFYLIIPVVIGLSKKNLGGILFGFILFFLLVKYSVIYNYNLPYSDPGPKLLTYYRYDCVAFGCLMGSLHFNGSKLFKSINGVHLIISVVLFIVLLKNMKITHYDYFPFAVCFGIMIAYLVNKEAKIKSPRWLIYIGTISYSLYLIHEIAIVYLVNMNLDKKSMALMHLLSIVIAVALASVTYFAIEKPFMKYFKTRLAGTPIPEKEKLGDSLSTQKAV
jgi:peptidoglycan/LPS O-acetylase OafA/YrhL